MDTAYIRNFCIIAHIDHGKSTLADRLLEATGTISQREMREQVLDQMDLERERGITIKAQAVQMRYRARDGQDYTLHLIDTPGHVDFTYEVSRSLAACEGALVVVDATQGIQAQTLANVYLALEHNLTLIPIVNKIDLPSAEPERVAQEIEEVLGIPRSDIIFASAKEGIGTSAILEAIVRQVPPPVGVATGPLRALIFDSKYDPYKGVIAYVRIVDGSLRRAQRLLLMASGATSEALEVGVFRPTLSPQDTLGTGEVGYIASGLKNARECQVGDTITLETQPAAAPLPGYRPAKPMVFAGLYPNMPEAYGDLREALERLHLNDAALSFEPETSVALGPGFRCGFLGLLHLDIVRERLEREYNLELLITAPSVEYVALLHNGAEVTVDSPAQLPAPQHIDELREPWMRLTLIMPARYIGTIMELLHARRGEFARLEYLEHADSDGGEEAAGDLRVLLEFDAPLAEVLADFYDALKSRSQGYATMDYSFSGYRPAPLVKLDVLVHNQPVDALSRIVHQDDAFRQGRGLVARLRELIPRQLFDVPIQAAVGSRVIARETVRALRKNVLAKCYGGDITRKRKLLEKQAEGKRRLKRLGQVDVPPEVFTAVLRREDGS